MKYIFFAIIISLAANCGGLELVEKKNEEGVVKEQYTVNTKTEQKEGMYKSFDSNGSLIEEAAYKNGKLDGERTLYYENGEVQAIETFTADVHHGKYLVFYENKKVKLQGDYIDGKMEGEWRGYYDNGQLKEIVQFENNNENGPFIEYHENGNLKAKGSYLNGDQEHGPLELYNENGELERKMDCTNGICKTTWTAEKS